MTTKKNATGASSKNNTVTSGNPESFFNDAVEIKVNITDVYRKAAAMPEGKEKKTLLGHLHGLSQYLFGYWGSIPGTFESATAANA